MIGLGVVCSCRNTSGGVFLDSACPVHGVTRDWVAAAEGRARRRRNRELYAAARAAEAADAAPFGGVVLAKGERRGEVG